MQNNRTRNMVLIGMLSAVAYIVIFITRFQFVPSADFLKYDPKDVVVAITGFLFGPLMALPVNIIASFFEMITIGTSGFIGMVMTVIATASFTTPAALIYRRKKTIASAVAGLVAGCVSMTVVMLLWNYILVPLYQGVPRDAVAQMMVPVLLPFNLVKSGINAAITMLLYKPVVTALRFSGLYRDDAPTGGKGKINPAVIAISLFFVVSFVIVAVLWRNS